jgi:hypothetical protein
MSRMMMMMLVSLAACVGGKSDGDDTGTMSVAEACELAADSQTCPECSSGNATCSFDGVEVTAASCGDCQARGQLYQALCDAGNEADRATIEADTVCEPEACVVFFDTCNDPCQPLCVPASQAAAQAPVTECDVACADTALPDPGECVNDGFGCTFQ